MGLNSALCGAIAIALVTAAAAPASETKPVDWGDLVDQAAQAYEDPYRDLTYDQIENLREIVVETSRIEEGDLTAEESALSEIRIGEARERFAEDEIDADWLVSQRWIVAERREKATIAANPSLDGRTVSLAGFAIPAPPDEDGTRIVYLVPERGMCSHMPPPSPNQMIRARISSDWSPTMIHEPVRLSGTLTVQDTNHIFRIVDGEMPMRASFVLDVSAVETFQDLRADTPEANEWTNSMLERLRGSGQLPSQQKGTDD